MVSSPDPIEAVDRDERADDESISEWDQRLLTGNFKEGYDIFRGDDRGGFRLMQSEYLLDRDRSRKREDEEHGQRMRFVEELHGQRVRQQEELHALFLAQFSNQNQVTNRDQLQSLAHRDLAIAQTWRDQARDSGEAVFAPEQSS